MTAIYYAALVGLLCVTARYSVIDAAIALSLYLVGTVALSVRTKQQIETKMKEYIDE